MVEIYPTPMSLMWTHLTIIMLIMTVVLMINRYNDDNNCENVPHIDTTINRPVVESSTLEVPVQCEFFEMCEVTGDVLESSVGDSRTPGHVEAHLEGWGWNKETMSELLTAILSLFCIL